ncbi:MAG: hypothetical protein H0X33_07190 [Taibaiella sp.]|nr:hypothetical protein [Taibaiella sp.]
MRQSFSRLPVIITCLAAFAVGMKQLREPDIWWQLLSGRWMLEHSAITRTDDFSYTMMGHKWVNVKWLYEVCIAGLEKALSPLAVLLLQSAVCVAIILLLLKIIKSVATTAGVYVYRSVAPIALLLFLAIVEYRMCGRPEMISHLLCTVFLYMLMRYTGDIKKLGLLVLLQCLWANMHEGYPIGLVMIGAAVPGSYIAYLLTKEIKYLQQTGQMLLVLIAAVLIILLNPNGVQLWKQPFEIYHQVWANKYTTELYSFTQPQYWTIQAVCHVIVLFSVLVYWWRAILNARKDRTEILYTPATLTYLFLIIAFGYLALTANRNIIFSEIILVPSVAMMLSALARRMKADKWKAAKNATMYAAVIAAVFYITIVSNVFYKATASSNRYGLHISMLHNPTGAADFIEAHNIQGRAFSDYFISSYLLWRFYPRFRSYIDLRDLDVFPAPFFDEYFSLYNHPNTFHQLDSQYHFNYVVLSTSQLLPLQEKLYWEKGYNIVYADPVAVIYLKENDANRNINSNMAIQKPFTWPEPPTDPAWASALTHIFNPLTAYKEEEEIYSPIYGATFFNAMHNYPEAIQLLLPKLDALQDDARAYRTLANSYNGYSKVTTDAARKKALADTAAYYTDKAKSLK